jgi:predicted HicB family RNase H-like nuclease
MNIDAYAYNITVRRATFEGEVCFEARVKELPDLIEYADTADEVYALAVDGIETTAEIMNAKGRSMPTAITPADDFSGRVTLRLPRSLHRALAESSDDEGVSLNQHLVNILSYYSGFAAGQQAEVLPWKTLKPLPKPAHSGKPKLVYSSDLKQASELKQASGW